MIKAEKEMEYTKEQIEEIVKTYNTASVPMKFRLVSYVKNTEGIIKEEAEVVEYFKRRPSDVVFATKVTDNIFVVEELLRYRHEEHTEERSVFYPYVKGDKNDINNFYTMYDSFEKALIHACIFQLLGNKSSLYDIETITEGAIGNIQRAERIAALEKELEEKRMKSF